MSHRHVRSLNIDKKSNRKGQETDTDIDVCIFMINEKKNKSNFSF